MLRGGRWFRGADEAFQELLLGAAALRTLKDGERLFSRGDPPSGLFAVLDGRIRITASQESGKEALLTVTEPPGWFGEIAVFDGLQRTHDAIADAESLVLHVPHEPLLKILAEHPKYWRELGVLVSGKLRLALAAMEDMVVLPIGSRIARRLVMMAEGYGEWHDRKGRVVELPQEQLAMMVSASRQTVNQHLKDFEAKGLIRVAYGEIEIVDLDGLKREAER
ncbi:MAG: Crp/Fnr family transcriptional regulator [Myxococcaceae bacterium]